jgi:hypothetical protein
MDRVSGQVASAAFLTAPRWFLFLSPLWLLAWIGLGHRKGLLRARSRWMLIAIPGAILVFSSPEGCKSPMPWH